MLRSCAGTSDLTLQRSTVGTLSQAQETSAHTKKSPTFVTFCAVPPSISIIELYAKLHLKKGYTRHPCSLFRLLRKLGYYKYVQPQKKPYIKKPQYTAKEPVIKWQPDVKYEPGQGYVDRLQDKFYQCTLID